MRSIRITFAAVGFLTTIADAQQYAISTYAGGAPPVTAAMQATSMSIGSPISVAADEKGNVYFASPDLNSVFKLDPGGALTRIAGSSKSGYSGDGGPATEAQMKLWFGNASALSSGLAVDKAGNLFIADTSNHCVRRVSPSGIITTVAGTGVPGFSGDGGAAVTAKLAYPWGVALDPAGNLFILDTFNHRIRKVSTTGIISTLAIVDGWALAVDSAGTVFVTNPGNGIAAGVTSKISPDGTVRTVAGIGGWGIAVDSTANLFVTDGRASIQRISVNGTVTTVAGNGKTGYSGDGAAATSAQFSNPSGIAADSSGNLLIADRTNYLVRRVSTSGVTTVAGNGTGTFLADCTSPRFASPPADDGPATNAQLRYPLGVAAARDGSLFIADTLGNRVRKVSPNGIMTTVAGGGSCGGFSGDGGPAAGAQLYAPVAVAVGNNGDLFIAEFGNQRIRKVSSSGNISTVAGDGTPGFSGDGGPATAAHLRMDCGNTICGGVAVDNRGNLFIADGGNNRVRRVAPDGTITTVAGNGTYGFSGDGGPGTSSQIETPRGLALDSADNLFIAEGGGRIRKVSPDGTITTFAGGVLAGSSRGFSGDGGPATSARLSWPVGLAVDNAGNLLIADPGANFETGDAGDDPSVDHRIRRVAPDGIVTTLAGTGSHDFSGDGGAAITAAFDGPIGIAVDAGGNIYIADVLNEVIRIMRPAKSSVLIGAVVDAASQHADPVSPGKIVVIYGAGLGPSQLIQNQPKNGQMSTELSGTTVSFNGVGAPILYTSATQVAVVVPYAVNGSPARVTVTYQGQPSADFTVPVAATAPSVFTSSQAGWGQAAAINAADGTVNSPTNPVKVGGYISLYATGEGQTTPGGTDGKVEGSTPARPSLPVKVTVGGILATVQYAGGAPGQVAGLMQVNVQIPSGVPAGGYVPIVLQVGDSSTTPGAVWIAVSAN